MEFPPRRPRRGPVHHRRDEARGHRGSEGGCLDTTRNGRNSCDNLEDHPMSELEDTVSA